MMNKRMRSIGKKRRRTFLIQSPVLPWPLIAEAFAFLLEFVVAFLFIFVCSLFLFIQLMIMIVIVYSSQFSIRTFGVYVFVVHIPTVCIKKVNLNIILVCIVSAHFCAAVSAATAHFTFCCYTSFFSSPASFISACAHRPKWLRRLGARLMNKPTT